MAKVREMTSGRPLPLIFNFTLPLLLGNLLQQTYSLADAAIVGNTLGINHLAAIGASSSVIFLILGFCNGCAGGFSIPIAQNFGARDYPTMRKFINNSLRLTLVLSVVLACMTGLLCADILHWMRTPELIFHEAWLYLLITFIGIPCTFFYNLLACIIRALGDSKTPFRFLLFSTVLNITLDVILIVGVGCGVGGAAAATVISQGLSAWLCYRYMMRHYPILHSGPEERPWDGRIVRGLLNMGVPMGLQFSITAIGSIMLQSANNALGTSCVAAFTTSMRIKMFFICPLESLGMAMTTFCGQNFGAGQVKRIIGGLKAGIFLLLAYWLLAFLVVWFGSHAMILCFVDASEDTVIALAWQFLRITVLFYGFLGMLCLLRYSIQGMGYTHFAMLSGVSEMIARILVSQVAVPVWHYTAVCFGDPLAWVAACLFLGPAFTYVYHQIKRRPATAAQG